jgi:hypothetical protein
VGYEDVVFYFIFNFIVCRYFQEAHHNLRMKLHHPRTTGSFSKALQTDYAVLCFQHSYEDASGLALLELDGII